MVEQDPPPTGSPGVLPSHRASRALLPILKSIVKCRSRGDAAQFAFSYWLGVSLLLQSRPCHPQVVGAFKQLLNNCLDGSDYLGFIDSCSQIRESLVTRGIWKQIPFKGLKGRWVRSIRQVIEMAYESDRIMHPSSDFDAVATFLGWLKRVPVAIRDTNISIEDYYENDRRLSRISFEKGYIAELRDIWNDWFGDFHLTEPFRPRHGSGSTADVGKVRSRKWDAISIDQTADVCLRYPDLQRVWDGQVKPMTRLAKLVFVPKQAGKDRTICMEPAWLQYLQQGIANQVLRYTHQANHPMSKLVDLYSQDRNRELCARAYVDGLTTLDLSDASDSVSWRLIGALCKGMPIYRYLFASRSTTTLIDGRRLNFDKYAPMGSALCFPIECMVFASIVELAHRIHYGKAGAGYHTGCSVYGDDIICPSEINHLVIDILTSLGFKVNDQKSCSGPYYESCGVEYLNGVRIKTIRHPRTFLLFKKEMSPQQVTMVSDLAGSLLTLGYTECRRLLLCLTGESICRVGRSSVAAMDLIDFTDTVYPYRGSTHWHSNWQCRSVVRPYVVTYNRRARSDAIQWLSEHTRRTRLQRIRDLYPRFVDADPRWSRAALISLGKFKWIELLRDGDVAEASTSRTGRLQQKIRRLCRTLWQ